MGLDRDPYLNGFGISEKVKLVAGFAISIRRGEHCRPGHEGPLVAGTVDKAMSNLTTSFSDNNKTDLGLNADGKTYSYLHSIICTFKASDPKETPHKAITPELLCHLFTLPKHDNFAQHNADLCNGAFFFACRSCKYSQTTGTRRTKIITIQNIVFHKTSTTTLSKNPSLSGPALSI